MPEADSIVINTGPIIALVAALGDLSVLEMYRRVSVPLEVTQEILKGGDSFFAVEAFDSATWLDKCTDSLEISTFLLNSLDRGEASVIQLALNLDISTVCIDELPGRRVARLNGLSVTGSIGILLRAQREGTDFLMQDAIARMEDKGIWLSESVKKLAFAESR